MKMLSEVLKRAIYSLYSIRYILVIICVLNFICNYYYISLNLGSIKEYFINMLLPTIIMVFITTLIFNSKKYQ